MRGATVSTDWGEEFEKYVDHFRRDAVQKMHESAYVMSLVPGEFDVKFATELGAAIMMDKPLLAVVMPGAKVTRKLKLVADHIVEADLDTEEGREKVAAAVVEFTKTTLGT